MNFENDPDTSSILVRMQCRLLRRRDRGLALVAKRIGCPVPSHTRNDTRRRVGWGQGISVETRMSIPNPPVEVAYLVGAGAKVLVHM